MKRRANKYYMLYALAVLLLLAGCKLKKPDGVLSENQMEDLLYDYHMAKALGENLPYGENYKRALYMEYVFKKHQTTEAVFDSSMVWYTRHADVLSKIYENINKRFKEEQDAVNRLIAIRDKKVKESPAGDSINVWTLNSVMHLTNCSLGNKITFSIPSDTNFKAKDTLQWEINYRFVHTKPDTTESVIMAMAVHYANDSIISQMKRIVHSGMYTIRLHADTLGDIKDIKGFVYYTGGSKDTIRHLFMDQISLMRYHATDTIAAAKTDSLSGDKPEKKTEPEKKDTVKPGEATKQQIERQNPDDFRHRRGERPHPIQKTVKE